MADPTAPSGPRRLETVLSGLILGEQLAWTGMFERSQLLPDWTRRKRRELEAQHEAAGVLETVLPFSLNQAVAPLYPGPGAHSEWFIFQAQLVAPGAAYAEGAVLGRWRTLGEALPARLTVAQRAACFNLRRGLLPPVSGHDNPHYFDDGACFRALALACLLGADELPLATVQDASISHAEDGVWGAQAVAAFVGAAGSAAERVAAARQVFPPGSWSARNVDHALELARGCSSVLELSRELSWGLATYAYSYGNAAAETVPAALALLSWSRGDPERALFGALAVPRLAGTLVPLVGALCGAFPGATVHARTLEQPLAGVALPFLAGPSAAHHLTELAQRSQDGTNA